KHQWLLQKAFGLANVDTGKRNGVDTIFCVASVSKQFTATLAAIAAHNGHFSLDDDIRKHVPELPDYGRPITIRNLIHHTNGLRDDGWLVKLTGRSSQYSTQPRLLRLITRQQGVNFLAGEKFSYGNTAYVLLAEIIERKTGQSLHAYARQKIFGPLGMVNTYYIGDPQGPKNYATPYQREGNRWANTGAFTELARRATGGVMTTLDDYGLWVQNLLAKDSKLDGGAELTRMLMAPDRLIDGSSNEYGFGLELGAYRGLQSIGHDGSGGGYKADTIMFPTRLLAVFAFWNNSVYPTDTVLQLVDLFLDQPGGESVSAKEKVIDVPAADLKPLVGMYREASVGSAMLVSMTGTGLTIAYRDPPHPIQAVSRSRFLAPGHLQLEFERDGQGRGIRLRQDKSSDLVIGTGIFERVQPPVLNTKQLSVYAGDYYSRDVDATYRFKVDNGRLVMNIVGSEPGEVGSQTKTVVMQPSLVDEFVSIPDRMVFSFQRDGGRGPSGFLLNAHHGSILRLPFKRNSTSPGVPSAP
ncbi:serine hydrolase domain-containing protein, partial [Steroidobacter sp.]|uniref:serine hydrolase domain-containing protein n=1 Tax=Steroidobacter sp. TaxID=1978227 RepID=UPI001A443000